MVSDRLKAKNSMPASGMSVPRGPWLQPMSSNLCSDVLSSTSKEVRDLVKDLQSFNQPKHTTEKNWLWTIERKIITRKG